MKRFATAKLKPASKEIIKQKTTNERATEKHREGSGDRKGK